MNEKELFKKAKHRVNLKKGFIIHFISFCGVVPILFLVNYLFTPGLWWFLIAFAGWGFGLMIHFIVVYGFLGERGRRWEALQIEKEMNRLFLEQGMEEGDEDFLTLDDYKKMMKDKEEIKRTWRDEDFV